MTNFLTDITVTVSGTTRCSPSASRSNLQCTSRRPRRWITSVSASFATSSTMYMSMERYIAHMAIVLQRTEFLRRKSPISPELEITDLRPLSPRKAQFFAQALGMCAWLSATVRIDGRCALSRISQYAASPCLGAYGALIHLLDYYQSTPTLCLRQSLHEQGEWTFYSDSDLAGNPEAACKRRSQLGYVALNNGCPIVWSSKASRKWGFAGSRPCISRLQEAGPRKGPYNRLKWPKTRF